MYGSMEWVMFVHLDGRLAIRLAWQNFNVEHYMKTFQPNCFIADAYRHYWLLLFYTTVTDFDLAWGSKQNLLALFSGKLFNWSGWNWMWCWSNSRWISWYCFWVRFVERSEITAILHTASKKLWRWCAFGPLWNDLVQTWYDDRYYWALHFSTCLTDLDFVSRSQECYKARTAAAIISQSFSQFEKNLVYC